jgi:hypothetical protein
MKHWLKACDLVETITELYYEDNIDTAIKAGRLGVVLDVYAACSEDGYDYSAVKVNLVNDNRVIRAPEKYFKLVQRPNAETEK